MRVDTKLPWILLLMNIGMFVEGCYHPEFKKADEDTETSVVSVSTTTLSMAETEGNSLTEVATGMGPGGSGSMASSSMSTSEEASTTSMNPGVCGDENVDPGESCDDGKNNGQEGLCREDCTICGDGIVQIDVEECDDGGESATCDIDCTWVACGDGVVNQSAGEDCEAEGENTSDCDMDCTLPLCGDGVVNLVVGEQCDDGNDTQYDGCEPGCQPTPWGVISAGGSGTCALLSNGKIRCWGEGFYGQLGYGNTEDIGDNEYPSSAGPVDLGNLAIQVAMGQYHTCALVVDGNVYCWGDGGSGLLGYGNTNDLGKTIETLPGSTGAVGLGAPAIQIAASNYHTCALLAGEGGKVHCWGHGQFGKLGQGSTVNVGDSPNTLYMLKNPLALGDPAIQVTTGSQHTCAILEGGKVRCWGYGNYGILGYGNTGGNLCKMNDNFSCGVNTYCCIGDNDFPENAGFVNLGDKVVQIAAGEYHTCALRQDGSVVCWGFNQYGQLGYGNTSNDVCINQYNCSTSACCVGDNEHPSSAGPVEIGGIAVQITARGNHSCALLADGNVRCWGKNSEGQLGYGHANNVGDDEKPSSELPLNLGSKVVQISAGDRHTCALLEGGDIQCWGYGNYGQLGYNKNTNGNICLLNNSFSCAANEICCLGDKQGEVPFGPVNFK